MDTNYPSAGTGLHGISCDFDISINDSTNPIPDVFIEYFQVFQHARSFDPFSKQLVRFHIPKSRRVLLLQIDVELILPSTLLTSASYTA